MILLFRLFFIFIYSFLVCIFGCIYCIFFSKDPRRIVLFGYLFSILSFVLNIKIIYRKPNFEKHYKNAVYIANHQNYYDMIIAGNVIQKNTILIGKKSLLWIPFFGLLYKLLGNLLIDRNDLKKFHTLIKKIVFFLKEKKVSFWIFPEGTRSQGRGILPFKRGAFYTAILAKVPIVPIVISDLHHTIKLNRWKNGTIIVEILPSVDTTQFDKNSSHILLKYCHTVMSKKFQELNLEIKKSKKII